MADTPDFAPGTFVRARWLTGVREYNAVVEQVNEDGTFQVLYEDGDLAKTLPASFMTANPDFEPIEKYTCSKCSTESYKWRKTCSQCNEVNPHFPKRQVAPTANYASMFTSFSSSFDWHQNAIDRAKRDCQEFIDSYPTQVDNPKANLNYLFYSNELPMRPNGVTIEQFHQRWWGDYDELEANHSFVQWIFPIREQGLNHYAQPLQKWEAVKIAEDPVLQGRLIKTYELMLDFYGMKLVDKATGEIARGDNYVDRYDNLERCSHNFLRITRILKCLWECGLGHYQAPFVRHVFTEIFEHQQLECCEQSARMYWVNVVKDETERNKLIDYAASFRPIPKQAKTKPYRSSFSTVVSKPRNWDPLPGKSEPIDLSTAKFAKDEDVLAHWKGGQRTYNATVKAVNLDGTYRVLYSDGDVDDYVLEARIYKKDA